MRTTLTLDDDLAMELHARARDERRPFKDVVNEAIRRGLASKPDPKRSPYRVKTSSMGLRAGVDPAGLKALLSDMDAERYLEIARRYEESTVEVEDAERKELTP